jgi:hypothetical protein
MNSFTVLAAILILWLLVNVYSRHNSLIEGMENPSITDLVVKGISNDITILEDQLHLKKYHSNYQTILRDLMKWCDLEVLKMLTSPGKINIGDGVTNANTELITSLNQYSQFKNTLQGVYDNLLAK